MKSLLDPAGNAELINRINQLKPGLQPAWGKMNVTQMLGHCQQPISVAFGELKLKRGLMGFLFGNIAKKKLMSDAPMPKNLPTVKRFIMPDNLHFEEEKHKLIAQLIRIGTEGAAVFTREPHPFFGRLTVPEWDTLGWKHLDHHLQQFGV